MMSKSPMMKLMCLRFSFYLKICIQERALVLFSALGNACAGEISIWNAYDLF